MCAKRYVSPNELHSLSYDLSLKIYNDKFIPTWIIALWRGGCPPAMVVQGFLKHYGNDADHIAIRTSSYDTSGTQREIRVHGLEYVIKNMNANDSVLIVDDIFDSGRSIKAVLDKMKRKLRNNFPNNIKVATVFYKPENNKTDIIPDYYQEITSSWLVFSHEFEDLTKEEIKQFMGFTMP